MLARLIHAFDDYVAVQHRDRELFRYVYASTVPAFECRKPYIHPLRTLAGHMATIHRPHDHLWHHGLAMTCAELSGQNFWGGATYVRDKGYQPLDNVGRQMHEGWLSFDAGVWPVRFAHRVAWITAAGERWIEEDRSIALAELNESEGCYTLEFGLALRNVSGRELAFGSPTTAGRPNAGYGGLYWRGPRDLEFGGRILAADGREGPDLMGQRSPWIALQGKLDTVDAGITVTMIDHPDNPRYPTKWFTRNKGLAGFAAAFSFDELLHLAPDAVLSLRYRLSVIDGLWPADRLEAHARAAWS